MISGSISCLNALHIVPYESWCADVGGWFVTFRAVRTGQDRAGVLYHFCSFSRSLEFQQPSFPSQNVIKYCQFCF